MFIIEWCNSNQGFMSAILSFLGLFISFIAVVISIRTARLPYKKKLILRSCINIGMSEFGIFPVAYEVTATNVGNREIYLTYLGYAVKIENEMNKMYPTDRNLGFTKSLLPTKISSSAFSTEELIKAFSNLPQTAKLYTYAIDSENKEYKQKCGTIGKVLDNLRDDKWKL